MAQVVNKEVLAESVKEPSTWEAIKPYLLWSLVILVVLGLLTWLTIWIIKKIKMSQDVYHRLYRERRKLCVMHADRRLYRKYWRYKKNMPIKAMFYNSTKLHTITLGYYMGHFYSAEGNLNLCISFSRKWGILFPVRNIIVVNKQESIIIEVPKEVTDSKGIKNMVKEEIVEKLPINIEHFSNDAIYLWAYGIDKDERSGFYFPVLKDSEGKVIDMSLPTYQSLRDVVLGSYLYEQTDMFVKVAKKSIDLNPTIRGIQKVSDSSQSIDTKQGGG